VRKRAKGLGWKGRTETLKVSQPAKWLPADVSQTRSIMQDCGEPSSEEADIGSLCFTEVDLPLKVDSRGKVNG
jgi:hypothetical protein